MAKNEKALAKTGAGALTAAHDYGHDFGQGFEHQTRDDISIPFLAVLQDNSPQVTDREDCKPGMLFNTVTEDVIDGKKGIKFVPATTQHVFVEWVPRDKGGGFVAVHDIDSDVVRQARAASKEFGKYSTPTGNDLVETFYVYATLLDENDEANEMAVLAFTSTKISVYKRFNTKLNMFTIRTPDGRKMRPPLFAHRVHLTTVRERNNKGTYFNFALTPAVNGSVAESLLPPGDQRLEAAKSLRDMVESGLAKAAYDSQDTTTADADEGTTDQPQPKGKNRPF